MRRTCGAWSAGCSAWCVFQLAELGAQDAVPDAFFLVHLTCCYYLRHLICCLCLLLLYHLLSLQSHLHWYFVSLCTHHIFLTSHISLPLYSLYSFSLPHGLFFISSNCHSHTSLFLSLHADSIFSPRTPTLYFLLSIQFHFFLLISHLHLFYPSLHITLHLSLSHLFCVYV
jgi:hypothetical protein